MPVVVRFQYRVVEVVCMHRWFLWPAIDLGHFDVVHVRGFFTVHLEGRNAPLESDCPDVDSWA